MNGIEFGAPVHGIRFRGFANSAPVSFKVSEDRGVPRYLKGIACRYNKVHAYKGGYDVFEPGCFAKTLVKGSTVRFLDGHDEANLFATSNGGGLELFSDSVCLSFAVTLPDSSAADELYRNVKSGQRREMSCGYLVEESHEKTFEGVKVRLITAARLNEISVVEHAAVPQTFVEIAKSPPTLDRKTANEADMLASFAELQAGFARFSEACS
jgi:HK97 family phage prohead protease